MLPPRELATVLAALRFWQHHGPSQPNSLSDRARIDEQEALDAIRTDCGRVEPLHDDDIDELCECLNCVPSLSEWVESCRRVSERAEQWAGCSDQREATAAFREVGRECRVLVERMIQTGWDTIVEFRDCELPGHFYSGVPGIIARVIDWRLEAGAAVERCDACERYPSDEAAWDKLRELGIA